MQQILQWLCKDGHEKEGQRISHSIKKKEIAKGKGADRSKDIVVSNHSGASQGSNRLEGSKFDIKKLKAFVLFCRKDIAKSCFYSTTNIKKPRTQGFDNMQQIWIQKMKKEDAEKGIRAIGQKADSSVHTGTKVLPITDTTFVEKCSIKQEKIDMSKGGSKTKTESRSRMKELLRWAMATKPEKEGKFMSSKVLHTRNHGPLQAIQHDDQASIDSPKISFSWEVESWSTFSSANSSVSAASSTNHSIELNSTAIHEIHHCHPKKGSWITTDAEFVVLEL